METRDQDRTGHPQRPGAEGPAGPPDLLADVVRIAADIERLHRILAAVIEFCERCERGEIRSRWTYRRFSEALGREVGRPRAGSSPERSAWPGRGQPPAAW